MDEAKNAVETKPETKPETKAVPKATKKPARVKATKKRHSLKEKAKLLAKYFKLCKGGKTANDAAEAVGVPYITLHYWAKQAAPALARGAKAKKRVKAKPVARKQSTHRGNKRGRKPGKKRLALVQVPVQQTPLSASIMITLQSGVKVECASANDAAAVLSVLAKQ